MLSLQRGAAAGRGSEVRPHRHPDGANGTRPKRASEYSLLAPGEPEGNPAAAEIQECGEGHKAIMRIGDQDARETETGDRNDQHALLAYSLPEDADKERRTLELQCTFNACSHQGGGGGGGGLTQ